MRVAALLVPLTLVAPARTQDYVNYEAPHTHSIAVTPDGTRLLALNTPDARLAVFSLANPLAPALVAEIRVGVGPTSVRPRTDDEVWVVDHVSDAISVVSLRERIVVATIRVGDEPGDVVFAGSPQRAFVSLGTAREVAVLDVGTHARVATVPVFGDDPRALATSTDGKRLWVAVHRSGNGTTTVPASIAPAPPKPTNANLPLAPAQGIIVDAADPSWSQLNVTLPDVDVVEIDAGSLQTREYAAVGTVLFGLAQRPGTGELWVANTEARNRVRFEPALNGHAIDSRLTRIDTGQPPAVTAFDLNPGIDYATLPNPAAIASALSQPTSIAFDPGGTRLFVAAFGTDRIGIVDPATGAVLGRVELGPATGTQVQPRSKRGPRALAHHPSRPVLYALNRIANTIAVVDPSAAKVVRELPAVFDPTPQVVREGRGFLYDAKLSGNGTMACAACHQDGTFDGVAWDLGDPGGSMQNIIDFVGNQFTVHPMKGPLLTQTLQGLRDTSPFHWRGDRRVLQDFNGAFQSLLGAAQLNKTDMDDFASFMESIRYPGNPNQLLDRTFATAPAGQSAEDGRLMFLNHQFNPNTTCTSCHAIDTGTRRIIQGPQAINEPQPFKVAQLRNVYKRTGRKPQPRGRTSGYGLQHDGTFDDVFAVLGRSVFAQLASDVVRKTAMMRFVESFDTGTAPIVGFARTITKANANDPALVADLALMEVRTKARDCDLIVHGALDGVRRGWVYDLGSGQLVPDELFGAAVALSALRAMVASGRGTLTALCTPPGSGVRMGVDRDLDFQFDGDERAVAFGAATPSCAPPLRLSTSSPSAIGNELFGIVVDGSAPATPVALMIALASATLPIADLVVHVDPARGFAWSITADPRGVGVWPMPIPNLTNLLGRPLRFQAFGPHPCGALGLRASSGLKITFGS